MGRTGIEWTDATYNPIVGCAAVSPGCAHCYAASVARRGMQPAHVGLVNQRGHWTGEVRCLPERLSEPLHWRKPRRVFVCSMSDLFHDDVPDEYIDQVFLVMAIARHHTFQVLTKRPERMRAYCSSPATLERLRSLMFSVAAMAKGKLTLTWKEDGLDGVILPNVWLGVSCEDQQRADERIPLLLQTPAAVRFVSAEPLLEAVNLRLTPGQTCTCTGSCRGRAGLGAGWRCALEEGKRLDWVIVGGESGPGARPCDVAWVRSIVEQCRAAKTPCFVKQLGANVRDRNDAGFNGDEGDAWCIDAFRGVTDEDCGGYQGAPVRVRLSSRKGGDPDEWPEDLRVREWPAAGAVE